MMNYTVIGIHLLSIFLNGISAENETCPVNNESGPVNWSEVIQEVGAIVANDNYNISEMKFYVMTPRSSPKFANHEGKPFDWSSSECLGKPILFNCHGWLSDGNKTWVHDLLSTFIEEYGGCAVSSDYSGATKNYNYLAAACETNNIANGIFRYITSNICKITDCTKKLQLHGHSLGAHACGIAGYLLKQNSGISVRRMMASDPAGPLYNSIHPKNASLHLSKESARKVIAVKTSCIAGSSLPEWAHQTQVTGGNCGCHQNQCPLLSESCNHGTSYYIMRSTMQKDFKDVKLKQCSSCACHKLTYTEPIVEDSLGWKSKGIPGVFKTGLLDVCLDMSNSLEKQRKHQNKEDVRLINKRRNKWMIQEAWKRISNIF